MNSEPQVMPHAHKEGCDCLAYAGELGTLELGICSLDCPQCTCKLLANSEAPGEP